ncbi:MAG: MCE family protein [Rhodocyclaceae bacterium]|jgi:phospholipid/cholesterol/gamma-HCH transport system substrate-binding protein|nr:MCE family protein [Rhodocyclaceae bacterium]MBK6907735.1 MCE family protein [Rhodocyclaceae bacterium]
MENRAHALVAGIFVVLLGSAVAAALWWLGQGGIEVNRYIIETRGNVTGLNLQGQVRYRGIRAGKVETIETDQKDPQLILVQIALDKRFRVTSASRASLGYQGLTGLAFVQIEDDGSSPEVLFPAGDELPRIAMRDGDIEGLFDRAAKVMEQLNTATKRLNKIFDERNLDNIARTLDNVAKGSEGIAAIPELVASLRQVFSPENTQRWQRTLAHVEATAGEAAPLTAEVRQLVAALTGVAQRSEGLVKDLEVTGNRVNASTLPQMEQMVRDLRGTLRQLSRVLEGVEHTPQMLLFGRDAPEPGPGEAGFVAPMPSR